MALFLSLVLSLCIPCYEVDARNNNQQERQHRFPRSQDLNSILPTRDNDFDCVDIYKQPAFEHPLLKNHKIQLNPTFTRDTMQSRSSYISTEGCPPGKVPIHRIKMKHQMSTNSSSKSQIGNFHQYSQSYPGHHFATLDTTQNTTYHGAFASINVYNPPVQANQYSLAQIWLQSGPLTELNSIQVGWGVFPSLYGDNQTRLTSHWRVDEYPKTGCYNLMCPGFVQVHPNYTFGGVLTPTSVIGGSTKYSLKVRVEQDQSTGHWWLTVSCDIQIGYWPKQLFTHLGGGASLIRYGGETFALPNMISPPMGSGKLPEAKFNDSCYFALLQIVDSEYNENEVNPRDMKIYRDTSSNCYDLLYHGYEGTQYRQAFLFGGPGGQCGI